jgi:hypothetical protein
VNWERKEKNFEDSIIYQAFKQRFKEGKNWEETEFYNQVLNQISSGTFKWGCINKTEWDEWLRKVDSLFSKIKENYEKPQYEFSFSKRIAGIIDKEGHLLIINGIHILSIARLLNISELPINIIARHKDWIKFKKRLLYIISNIRKSYQILLHPDLKDIPYLHGEDRFNLIKEHLSISQGKLLDIGANYGYFSHKFEDYGFNCYAVEQDPYSLYLLKKLKIAENKKFKVISKSIFDYNKDQDLIFDVVLALNVFHHFLKKKNTFINFIKLLKRLKVKELFLETHHSGEFKKIKVYRYYNPDQFLDFIIKNSRFNKPKFLGKTWDGRPIYKLLISP